MTAAARRIAKHAQPVAHRGDDEFVAIEQAVRLLGCTTNSLRLECARKLASVGMARQIRKDGRLKWCIHRSHDVRLASAREDSQRVQELLARVSHEKRDLAQRRMKALLEYRSLISGPAVVGAVIGDWIQRTKQACGLDSLSYRTLRRWNAEAPPSDNRAVLMAWFIDGRGGDRTGAAPGCSPEAWREFESVWLNEQQWKIAKAWRYVRALAQQNGWSWISLSRCKQLIHERLDPSRICMARDGIDVWRKTFGLKLEQHPEAYAAGELWVGDHSTLDFFVKVMRGGKWRAVRPTLTAWQDWRTRLIAGWHLSEQGDSDTIRYALHHGMSRLSHVPTRVWIDNGKDFASETTTGITKAQRRRMTAAGLDWREHFTEETGGLLAMLNIDTHFARPYNHDGKARLERLFGTMHNEFDREFASYCGHKPGAVAKHNVSVEQLPSLDEVRKRFDGFMQWYHDRSEHEIADLRDEQQRPLSPAEAWRTWLTTRTIMPAPEAMALLLKRWVHPKAVTQLGIGLDFGTGRKVYYGAGLPDLQSFQGKKGARLHVTYDPENVSEIFVYDSKFRFLCIAPINNLYGGVDAISRAALREGMDLKREHEKAAKSYLSGGRLALMSAAEAGREAQQRRDADRIRERRREGIAPEAVPGSMRLVRTPVDEELTAVRRAEMRQAAGAETQSPGAEFKMPRLQREDRKEETVEFEVRLSAPQCPQEEEVDFNIWEGLKR